VGPLAAIAIGGGVSAIGYLAVAVVKPRLQYDDALDVFGIHGLGGIWGALATGLFARAAVGGTDGLFFGNPRQFGIQAVSVLVTVVYSLAGSVVLYKVVDWAWGMRVDKQSELLGLDISQHKEVGYTVLE
jgi:Amt family ammonium transporter